MTSNTLLMYADNPPFMYCVRGRLKHNQETSPSRPISSSKRYLHIPLVKHPALVTPSGPRALCPEGFLSLRSGGSSSFVELIPCNIVISGLAPKAMRQGYAPRPRSKATIADRIFILSSYLNPSRNNSPEGYNYYCHTISMVWSRALFARQNNGGSVPTVCFGLCSTSRSIHQAIAFEIPPASELIHHH